MTAGPHELSCAIRHSGTQLGPAETRELILVCQRLGALLMAGEDILRAIHVAREQVNNPALRAALDRAYNDMTFGWTLAQSLGRHPELFSPFVLDMVRQGEAEGVLSATLADLADTLEKQLRLDLQFPVNHLSDNALGDLTPASFTFATPGASPGPVSNAIYRLALCCGAGLLVSAAGWFVAVLVREWALGLAVTFLGLGVGLGGWGIYGLRDRSFQGDERRKSIDNAGSRREPGENCGLHDGGDVQKDYMSARAARQRLPDLSTPAPEESVQPPPTIEDRTSQVGTRPNGSASFGAPPMPPPSAAYPPVREDDRPMPL